MNREHAELEHHQQNQQLSEKSARTKAREAFFIEFAEAIRTSIPANVPLVLTGGFRTRAGMEAAMGADKACDMVGIARPAVMNPRWAKDVLLNPAVPDEDAKIQVKVVPAPLTQKLVKVKALGASAEAVSFERPQRHVLLSISQEADVLRFSRVFCRPGMLLGYASLAKLSSL